MECGLLFSYNMIYHQQIDFLVIEFFYKTLSGGQMADVLSLPLVKLIPSWGGLSLPLLLCCL